MEEKEKSEQHYLQCARDRLLATETAKLQGTKMSQSVSTEFVKLEVQIAVLLFAVIGFFLQAFAKGPLSAIQAKLALTVALLTLIISLIMGLIHLKCEEKFIDMFTGQRVKQAHKWRDALEGKGVSFDQAKAFHEGAHIGGGLPVTSPQWPWILQTIFLGIGITCLFTLLIVFIFTNGSGTI